MKKIAVFASGAGSNAKNLIQYFNGRGKGAEVSLIVTGNPKAGVLVTAAEYFVPTLIVSKEEFRNPEFSQKPEFENIDLIVLAGFLWMIPDHLIQRFPNSIINIHPALLPKFGGKGMYGAAVHRAVREAGDTETGISIHRVNEKYDEGEVIFQAKCAVTKGDTPEQIEAKVRRLEMKYFPKAVEDFIKTL
jgi:phosphoribosylglycinamide formyltransferase 1